MEQTYSELTTMSGQRQPEESDQQWVNADGRTEKIGMLNVRIMTNGSKCQMVCHRVYDAASDAVLIRSPQPLSQQ